MLFFDKPLFRVHCKRTKSSYRLRLTWLVLLLSWPCCPVLETHSNSCQLLRSHQCQRSRCCLRETSVNRSIQELCLGQRASDWLKIGGPLCPICSLLTCRPYAKLGNQLDDRRWNWLSEAWYRAPHHIPHAGWWCLLESPPKPIGQKYSVYADMKGAAINRILKQYFI